MSVSRRAMFAQLAAASMLAWRTSDAHAQSGETVEYTYDVHGRITRAEYSNGVVVNYVYDNAGNRITVSRIGGSTPPTPPVFSATIQVTGSSPVNLRTLADNAGYDGVRDAAITFQVANNVTLFGAAGSAASANAGGAAIDTGVWPSSMYTIALTLQISGKIYGGGGRGVEGASAWGANANGGVGGDAVYARENFALIVNAGGELKGGGGGGGGGASWSNTVIDGEGQPETTVWPGGSGGGGFPNGTSEAAAAGTPTGGGAGGAGQGASGTRVTGAGGSGGGAATAGVGGASATGTGGFGSWLQIGSGSGGAAGYAIRKNGKTVTVTNNGTINGTIG